MSVRDPYLRWVEQETGDAWEQLHRQERHRLEYPSEDVVRFLSRNPRTGRALDIGCGTGRHSVLLGRYGYDVDACDQSLTAMLLTRGCLHGGDVRRADMTALPYEDERFAVAVAYGVFYYADLEGMATAVAELWRVLEPGGVAFVVTRTIRDWRRRRIRKGKLLLIDESEDGMTMTFLAEDQIRPLFQAFSRVSYELSETTTGETTRRNSDWLITVTR